MKKLTAFLIIAALILSLAACGGSGKNASSGSASEERAAETPQSHEAHSGALAGAEKESDGGEAHAETEASAEEPPDDAALAEAEKAKIVGEWHMGGVDAIRLVFNEDGTGCYQWLTEKTVSFTYFVYVSHKAFGNGEPYDDYLLNISYDTGDVEDIIFFFNRDTGNLCFHNSDNGGYSGVIDYAEWAR